MPQTLLTPTIITRESLEILENNLVMANLVNRRFENKFVKIGTQLTIRKPNRFVPKSGATLQLQDIQEPSVLVTINKQAQVSFQFSSADLTLTVEEFRDRYLVPAMETMANQIDYDVASNWTGINNVVGTAGATPSTFANSVALTGRRLDDNGAPRRDRSLVVNPASSWGIATGQSNAFVTDVSKPALIEGYVTKIGDQSIYMDQNIQASPASTYGGTPLTNAATPQTGAALITDGWTVTTTVLKQGTSFTIDGVYAVNPQNRQSTGVLMNFVATADTVTDGSGNSTIAISPAIVASGAYQNVTNGAANNKAITILTGLTTATTTINNLAFCKDAFGLICVPLELPGGVDMAARETYKNISMRCVRQYDINNDVFPTRLDVLYGTTTYYQDLAVRLLG